MRLNKIILLLTLVCASFAVNAQQRIAREVHIGAIGGSALSSYSFSPSVTQGMAPGVTLGVAARYIEEKVFGLQVEMLLTRRGMRDRFDENPELSFQRDLTYIEVPFMAHIYFNCGKRNEIALDLGPKLAYFLGDSSTSHLEGEAWEALLNGSQHKYQHHDMPIEKKFDYGIQAGLGYEFKFNEQMSLQLQGRYYFGLGNIFPDTKADVFEASNNHQIQIVASLWFRIQIAKYKLQRKVKQYSKKK